MTSTLTNTLPMAAMFTRNKYIGWGSLVFAVQNWLGESAESKKAASQPAIFSVGMAGMALMVVSVFLLPWLVDGKWKIRALTETDISPDVPPTPGSKRWTGSGGSLKKIPLYDWRWRLVWNGLAAA